MWNKPDPKIDSVARPIRIAYVLEDGEDAHQWLDEVFAKSFARHGGRQSLIVPCANGQISQRYRDWLKAIDPDVVMLLTYQNEAVAADLSALLGDTLMKKRSRTKGEIERHPRVSLESPALSALSWIPFFKTVSGHRRLPVDFILDCYPPWDDDGLIKDNFGTLYGSLGQFPVHEQIGVRPLMLTPENPPENRWHCGLGAVKEIHDSYEMLGALQREGVATLAHLSNLNCQPFRPDHSWRDAFCLVIGDSFEDRVACWNAGLLFDDASNQIYKTLRVPTSAASNAEKTAKLASFLRGANWIGGNSGPPKIVVRSYSHDEGALAEFVARIGAESRAIATFAAIASLDECCPAEKDIHRAYRALLPSPSTNETSLTEPTTFVTVPAPFHLKYTANQHPILSQGAWYVDLTIDKLNDHGRFSNIRETWMLPKRRQLIRQFVKVDGSRILRFGNLSVPVSMERLTIEVTQPSDEELFRSLLTEVSYHAYDDVRFVRDLAPAYKDAKSSDKGRYLSGLLGMFGSLSDVEHVMDKRFWRGQFFSMAAPANDQRDEVITLLQRRLNARGGAFFIEDQEGWERLADQVVRHASRLKIPRLRTRYERLLERWIAELKEAIEQDDHLKQQAETLLAEAPGGLKSSLGYLLDRRVFYRGHEWVCRNCSHRNWKDLSSLSEELPCEVCASTHRLPVDVAMDLRLNEFFATCLREHDTLTVACILSALRRQSKTFFTFHPQTAIYRKYAEEQGGHPSRELDILCICDGRFVVGEAKASAEMIAQSDIEDLANAAIELGVDVAVLAAVTDKDARLESKARILRGLLPATIEVWPILAGWDESPSTYL